jgi:hypothetical protein
MVLPDKSDKEIALELIDNIEKLYLRDIAFKAIFEVLLPDNPQSWQRHLEIAENNPQYVAGVRAVFQPVRERVLNAPDLTAVVRDILGTLEQSDQDQKGEN